MIIKKDWTQDAARDIIHDSEDPLTVGEMAAVIQKHCPFKEGVVYEEVGETSRKLDEILVHLKYLRNQV